MRIVMFNNRGNPISDSFGYRTLSRAAVNSFFTSTHQNVGNYLVKLYAEENDFVLMSGCSNQIELEEKLDDFFFSEIKGEKPEASIIQSQNGGTFMCCTCSEGIVVGFCESQQYDEVEILTYCFFSLSALNSQNDSIFRRTNKLIQRQHWSTINFKEARSALLADVFVSSSYCSA